MTLLWPTKYKAEYCQMLIQHMAQGLSYKSFAGKIGVHRSTMYDWEKAEDQWLEAKGIGEGKRLLHDEENLERLIAGEMPKEANAASLIFKLKTQHRWKEETLITQHNVSETYEQYIARKRNESVQESEGNVIPLHGEDHED